jgi:hypothetical protein
MGKAAFRSSLIAFGQKAGPRLDSRQRTVAAPRLARFLYAYPGLTPRDNTMAAAWRLGRWRIE